MRGENGSPRLENAGFRRREYTHIKASKVRAIRFSTLDALCEALGCQPGDILGHVPRGE